MSRKPPSATSNIRPILVPELTRSKKHSSAWASMLTKYPDAVADKVAKITITSESVNMMVSSLWLQSEVNGKASTQYSRKTVLASHRLAEEESLDVYGCLWLEDEKALRYCHVKAKTRSKEGQTRRRKSESKINASSGTWTATWLPHDVVLSIGIFVICFVAQWC